MTAAARSRPPRPHLTVRIGALGHRPNRLAAAEVDRIDVQCRAVIAAIRDLAAPLRNPLIHAPDAPILSLLSPLAEGSDRILAKAGLALGCALECPLPFSATEYERDFDTRESRAEFHNLLARAAAVLVLDGERADEAGAYETAGRTVVGQSDLLIAVWDGAPAAGRGGTAQIVAEAVTRSLPVVWINARDAVAPRMLVAAPGGGMRDEPFDRLGPFLAARFAPPSDGDHQPRQLVAAYFAERRPRFDAGQFFKIFRDLVARRQWRGITWRVADYEAAARSDWESEIARVPTLPEPARRLILDRLCPYFAWADRLAERYADLYRSSYIATNLFSALAVLFGISGLVTRLMLQRPVGETGAIFEMALIAAILAIIFVGRRRKWHARWLDYRQLAEQLRQLRYLAPLACAAPAPRLPAHVGTEPRFWVDGLLRAILRELGLPQGHFDPDSRAAYAAWLGEVIADQIGYHERNRETMTRLDHNLHNVGRALFFATLASCVIRIGLRGSDFLLICAAALPALGAAFYAIRNQGEFARIADRSQTMQRELVALRETLTAATGSATLAQLQSLALQAAEIMVAETIDWRVVFRYRPLVLPG